MALDTLTATVNTEEKNKNAKDDSFLSLAVHELRTPLSVVKWYTEMLLDGDAGSLTEDQLKYLKTIQISNQRSIDLIKSLLNVSRLDLGTFSINPTETDLRFLVKQILIEYKTQISGKKLKIEEKYEGLISGVIPFISVDKQIATVLIRTLILNALSFSSEETNIIIGIKEVKQGDVFDSFTIQDDSLLFSVYDSGIGIPEKEKEKVFSKLFKGSNAVEKGSNGSGLGLYIAKLILDKIGGSIWFSSQENIGSTFYITFPKSGMPKKEGRTTLD